MGHGVTGPEPRAACYGAEAETWLRVSDVQLHGSAEGGGVELDSIRCGLLALILAASASAQPPSSAVPEDLEVVLSVVRSPDSTGFFEVEVGMHSMVPIPDLRVEVAVPRGVEFVAPAPSLARDVAADEWIAWRIPGHLRGTPPEWGPCLAVVVQYKVPVQALRKLADDDVDLRRMISRQRGKVRRFSQRVCLDRGPPPPPRRVPRTLRRGSR